MLPANSLIPIHDENPTRTFSYVTLALIVLNVLVFFQEPGLARPRDQATACALAGHFYRWGLVPHEIAEGRPVQVRSGGCPGVVGDPAKNVYLALLTSMFLHGGILHLAGNMLFLWIFGNNVEDRLGRVKFIVFYLLTGVIASLAHVAANPDSIFPTVGASGAIAGVLGAYLVMFPRARVTSVVPIPVFFLFMLRVQLPAVVVLGLWFLSQFFIGSAQQLGGAGVAWMAHVGGFLAGMALILPFGGRRRRAPQGWEW